MSRRTALASIGGSLAIAPVSSISRSSPVYSDEHESWRRHLRELESAACDAVNRSDEIRYSLPANVREYLHNAEYGLGPIVEDPELEAVIEAAGYNEATESQHAIETQVSELRKKLYQTPARSVFGIAAQARALADELHDPQTDDEIAILVIADALERLISGDPGAAAAVAA